ncbi:DUF134 domain-containing protein [Candidatus Peregrinibacteria bacterium]|nr:DUF134 domain-containing protein [Candidatus Peregrinibacteria bacterium]
MARPKTFRRIAVNPEVFFFKPQGVPMRFLEQVDLSLDELEAVRLGDFEEYDMIKAARKMQISKSTFQRLLSSSHKKIADALIEGKAIRIHKIIDFNYS